MAKKQEEVFMFTPETILEVGIGKFNIPIRKIGKKLKIEYYSNKKNKWIKFDL